MLMEVFAPSSPNFYLKIQGKPILFQSHVEIIFRHSQTVYQPCSNYNDAPTEGIRRVLEQETNTSHPRSQPVDTSRIDYIRMGTTVATNALLERKGERMALVTTKGFRDLQYIGNQSRPKIFDLEIKRPELLYEDVTEIDERVILLGEDQLVDYQTDQIVFGISGETLVIAKKINPIEVREKLARIYDLGIRSVAVVLMHSYTYAAHERLIYEIAVEMGFQQISLSSEVMPMVRIVPRGCTTCVDAYLTPIIKRYLASFTKGFDADIKKVHINFMQSDGGLTPMDSFYGNRAILSGPAGGVVGYAITSKLFSNPNLPVIGFDMGGTSTDVSRYADSFDHVFETTTAGVTIQSPQLDINTVAAGGGSRLFYRNGLFVVGPESAGAHPGPACYRKHGPLTVTDANVLLGRIQPHLFPAIFGETEKEMLDVETTTRAFEALTEMINHDSSSQHPKKYTIDEVAYGFIRVANEAMARPIRNLTTMKGYDVTKHALSCFGGAGPQHCCAIAKSLGMKKVYVHRYSGILSAYGLSLADVVVEKQEPFTSASIRSSVTSAMSKLSSLAADATAELISQGFRDSDISIQMYLNCRYHGTDTAIMTLLPQTKSTINSDDLGTAFEYIFVSNYEREYGFKLVEREVLVDDVRVRAIGQQSKSSTIPTTVVATAIADHPPKEHASVYFEGGRRDTPVYFHSSLVSGVKILGPAIIVQDVATVIVEPNCSAVITSYGDIEISIDEAEDKIITCELDPIYMSIFSHRFMGKLSLRFLLMIEC
jgi:5-oxoprolinase (ATP-hydrolysing)